MKHPKLFVFVVGEAVLIEANGERVEVSIELAQAMIESLERACGMARANRHRNRVKKKEGRCRDE